MNETKIAKRDYGVDALKIVSMFMIVVVHVLAHGGGLNAVGEFSPQYQVAWFIEIAMCCAVNCYALASGYVGGRYKYTNIILLWLRTVFYTVLFMSIAALFRLNVVSSSTWKGAFFPIMTNQYWYVTAYFGLFFLMPILNIALDKMNKKDLGRVLAFLLLLSSVLPLIFRTDVFNLNRGYSLPWLVILYLIGGYCKRYPLLKRIEKRKLMFAFFLLAALGLVLKNILESAGKVNMLRYVIAYTSPIILLMGLCLLLFFSRVKIEGRVCKIIAYVSSLTFGVYIIHENAFFKSWLISNKFPWLTSLPFWIEPVAILSVALGIYVLCLCIDSIRDKLFRVLKLKERIYCLEKRVIKVKNEA